MSLTPKQRKQLRRAADKQGLSEAQMAHRLITDPIDRVELAPAIGFLWIDSTDPDWVD